MKTVVSGAVAIATLVLIDSAFFNAKFTTAGCAVLQKTGSAMLRLAPNARSLI